MAISISNLRVEHTDIQAFAELYIIMAGVEVPLGLHEL
jgi:hypothetical protein